MAKWKQTRWLAGLAIAGNVILLASAWLLPSLSEYDLIGDNISELALGEYGGVQNAAFLLRGLATLGLAVVIRRLTDRTRGALIGASLVFLNGVGLVVAAFVPTDRLDNPNDVWAQSVSGAVHTIAAGLSLIGIVIGMFVLSWIFARDCRWHGLTRWSALLAASSLSLLFAQAQGPLVGLMQRLLASAVAIWMIMVAVRARRVAAAATDQGSLDRAVRR